MQQTHRVKAILAASDPARIIQRVTEQALRLVPGADGSAFGFLGDQELVWACGSGSQFLLPGVRVSLHNSFTGHAMRTGETLCCNDTERDERVDRAVSRRVNVRSIVCVPLYRSDEPLGMLAVVSSRPDAFTERDVAALTRLVGFLTAAIGARFDLSRAAEEVLATDATLEEGDTVEADALSAFVAGIVDPKLADELDNSELIADVMLEVGLMAMVLQPIVSLGTGELVGAEALARFNIEPPHPPDYWFAEARRVGLGVELQLLAAANALSASRNLPPGAFVAINVDPEALMSPRLAALLEHAGERPVVLELTEHFVVDDYPGLRRRLRTLRQRNVRLAIDDTGAGYSSLSHIVQLAPDFIKLDLGLVRGIDIDPVRRSLVAAVTAFAAETGAKVVAEGIETAGELHSVRELSVDLGQGYLLGRPSAPEALVA